jgi:hypothetical protein
MTGKCSVCGQAVRVGRRRKLRPHLVNPKDPQGAVCPGRDPGQLPSALPYVPARRKARRKQAIPDDGWGSNSVRPILSGGFETSRRRH